MSEPSNIYDICVRDYTGKVRHLSEYKGKVLLIVNVASTCGFAKRAYTELTALLTTYHKDGLRILLFPCKQFMNQEFTEMKKIKDFVDEYDDRFDLMDMIDVRGSTVHPLYKYLIKNLKGWLTNSIKWNFTTFLIGRNGELARRYGPTESIDPMDSDIVKCMEVNSKDNKSTKGYFFFKLLLGLPDGIGIYQLTSMY